MDDGTIRNLEPVGNSSAPSESPTGECYTGTAEEVTNHCNGNCCYYNQNSTCSDSSVTSSDSIDSSSHCNACSWSGINTVLYVKGRVWAARHVPTSRKILKLCIDPV